MTGLWRATNIDGIGEGVASDHSATKYSILGVVTGSCVWRR